MLNLRKVISSVGGRSVIANTASQVIRNLCHQDATKFKSTTSARSTIKPTTNTMIDKNALQNHIVWMDLEMTGLDYKTDKIMEISCLITDPDLTVVAEAPTMVIHHSEDVLDSMNEWCIKHHGASGLTQQCRDSKTTIDDAQSNLLEFLKENIPKGTCPLGGNTVYMDRLFIREYLPLVDDYMHYRIIDVSSIKELCKRWKPEEFANVPKKKFSHRSLDDILESIAELKYYKKHVFNLNE